jgi:hypothetical protein
MKDLGTANGWSENCEEKQLVQACWDKKHVQRSINLGRCYNKYVCDICQITYTVDSSD